MPDFTPALVAIASIVGGVAAILRGLPKLRRLFRVDQAELVTNLREVADTWEEKYNLVKADLADERLAHQATRDELADERRVGARCRSDLDDARAEIRELRRKLRREATT